MSVTVNVIKAVKLPKADFKGHGDFCVKLEYGGETQTTNVVSGENPEWNEVVVFQAEGSMLTMTIIEKDKVTDDTTMGSCEVTPGDGEMTHELPVKLNEGGKGCFLTITTTLGPPGTPPPPPPEEAEASPEASPPPPPMSPDQDAPPEEEPEPVLRGVQGKALLIGINYVGQENVSLTQSVSCVRTLADSLKTEGFEGHVRVIADDGSIDTMPTKRNIEDSINWLVTGAQPQDGLILYFAGRLRREENGTVSVCPADHKDVGVIPGKDILSRLCRSIPQGCRVIWVLDTPGGGSVSPSSHQPLLPFRHTFPETDLANFAPPSAGTQSGVVVLSASSLDAMVEGAMCKALTTSLAQMRGQSETPLDEAGRLFLKRVNARFSGLLDPVINDGGYVSSDFAAWGEKTLPDLQAELQAFGVPTTRAAPLQNIAQQIFKEQPDDVLVPAPPSIATLMRKLHENHPSTGPNFTIMCESDARIDPEVAFLPSCPPNIDVNTLYSTTRAHSPANSSGIVPYSDQHFTSTSDQPVLGQWASYVGYISTGGDILGSPRLMTVEEALEVAKRYPECKGFSLRGENPNPGERTWVYFKNKWDLHGTGWTTYKRPDGSPALQFSQQPVVAPSPPHSASPSPSLGHGIDPWYRQRLVNFYNHYNPSKLPSVVPTLHEYKGHEEQLFYTLAQKYGPEPPDSMADPLAPGWRLVESPQGDLYYKHLDGRKQWERPLDVVYNIPLHGSY
eukprot:TRINITY_DN10819_c0_g1_i1.p1 TRINITY_DN10819_c0_g1~~TRINITY_DN10819_c0_g1_i1.p1  ORF type:complete len:732 (+),score=159.27 TRINITY_DN10819_c0_g1_i1:107-2302(+)